MKSSDSEKATSGVITKGMSHHIKGYFMDFSLNAIILHHVASNLSNNECSDDIASRIVALGKSVEKEYNQVYKSEEKRQVGQVRKKTN